MLPDDIQDDEKLSHRDLPAAMCPFFNMTQFWDKNFQELDPLADARPYWITVDVGEVRWAARVVHSGVITNLEKLDT